MKKLFYFLFTFFIVAAFACSSNQNADNQSNNSSQPLVFDTVVSGNLNFHVETQDEDGGFGYVVAFNGRKVISQHVIPCVEGRQVFKTKCDALKVGRLVVLKMIQSPGLPSITEEELIDLKIINK